MKIGLVLSGGGARGFMHLGVIQALQEYGVQIGHISATSAGALAGGLYARGYTPLEILGILSQPELYRSVRIAFGGSGLLRIRRIEAFFARYFAENDFAALNIPLTITATDLFSAETVVFESGPVLQPILASCGLPGLFEPYRYQDRDLVDGGVLNNMPVEYLPQGTDVVIGAHCNPFRLGKPLKSSFEVAYRSLLLAVHHQNIARLQKCGLLIEPEEMSLYSIFDFHKARRIYTAGYETTVKALESDQYAWLTSPQRIG